MGRHMGSAAVPTVDFWPWRKAASLNLSSPSATATSASSDRETKMVMRFDDGMGRVVAARALSTEVEDQAFPSVAAASEVVVLDFA